MMKRTLRCGAALSLFALAACSGKVQSIGDATAGSGGDSSTTQTPGGSGSKQPRGGSASTSAAGAGTVAQGGTSGAAGGSERGRGGAAWAPGTCDPPCSEGYGCYEVTNDPAGFCAPLCDDQNEAQGNQAELPCSNSVRGGAGTCVFSESFGWPFPGNEPGGLGNGSNFVTGLCSNACDPILQDCPAGYKCDLTDTFSALHQQGIYACMPNKNPLRLGEACDGTGDGKCGPGLTCSIRDDAVAPVIPRCEAFCDSRDTKACPAGQKCTETLVTMQDNDPNIGVCE